MSKPQTFIVLLAISFVGTFSGTWAGVVGGQELEVDSTPKTIEDLRELEIVVIQAVEKALPATVAIGVNESAGAENTTFASGVIISKDGLILSQHHVTHARHGLNRETGMIYEAKKPGDKVDVILKDGRRLEAELLGADEGRDLSLLKLEPGEYPFISMSEPGSAKLGDWVLKFGHPLGYFEDRGAAVRLGRSLYTGELNVVADCAAIGGDSGGPLVNLDGDIVGMIENSRIPNRLTLLRAAVTRGTHFIMGYSTIESIQDKMPAMLDDQMFRSNELDQQSRQFENNPILPLPLATQGSETLDAWKSVTSESQGSVVELIRDDQQVALGTVVSAEGLILTRAGEVDGASVRLPSGLIEPKLIGVDKNFDLALLKIETASELKPVEWAEGEISRGRLVVAPDSRGEPLAMGIISTEIRKGKEPYSEPTVRTTESGPSKIQMSVVGKIIEDGFKVELAAGDASKAGIRTGDLIVSVDGKSVLENREALLISNPTVGDEVSVLIRRDGTDLELTMTIQKLKFQELLDSRDKTSIGNYPAFFDHDMPLFAKDFGGPVLDLNGRAICVSVSNSSLYGCSTIPAGEIEQLIERLVRLEK